MNDTPATKASFLARIVGIVQGVGYRYFAYRKAHELGITGYVKNLPDGSVEVFAEGDRELLEMFLMELRKGPRWAEVHDVHVDWFDYQGKYQNFEIIYF